MEVILRLLENIEIWIYVIGGIMAILFLTRLISAWQEGRTAIFGLERDSAQRRFSLAMTLLIIVLVFVMTEFILVSFVSPALPQTGILRTPTIDLLSTATATLAAEEGTAAPGEATRVVINALATVPAGDCIPGQIEWIEPKPNESISNTVTLKGTVNVSGFGFYKYEYSQPGTDTWMTIAAGNQPVAAGGELGVWNISQMVPGDYLLRLVVVDNQNNSLPACIIPVRILAPQ